MTKYLLNSAVIAAGGAGWYCYTVCNVEDLRSFVGDGSGIESRIGYDQTAKQVEAWTGWLPPINRDTSLMRPGDRAMVVRLKRRIDPTQKGDKLPVEEEDWEIGALTCVDPVGEKLLDVPGVVRPGAFQVQLQPAARRAIEERSMSDSEYDREEAINSMLARHDGMIRALVPRLSRAEWGLVFDALNGSSLRDWSVRAAPVMLLAEIEDAIRLNQSDQHWGVDGPALLAKLKALTAPAAIAVVDAAERFWAPVGRGRQDVDIEDVVTLGGDTSGDSPAQQVVRQVVDILSGSRHAFRSKQIAEARRLLETLLV